MLFNPSKRAITATRADGKVKQTVHYPSDQSALEFQNVLEKAGVKYDSKGVGGFSWTSVIASFLPDK